MIAFIRPPEKPSRSVGLRHVHQFLAVTLLPRSEDSGFTPPVARWKAWLFIGWLMIVALWGIRDAIGSLL